MCGAPRRRDALTRRGARCKRTDDVQCVGASAGKRMTHVNMQVDGHVKLFIMIDSYDFVLWPF